MGCRRAEASVTTLTWERSKPMRSFSPAFPRTWTCIRRLYTAPIPAATGWATPLPKGFTTTLTACWKNCLNARRWSIPRRCCPWLREISTCNCRRLTGAWPNWRARSRRTGRPPSNARAIERHLRTAYGYTLELPDKETHDPLANFLFQRKKGYCEYFASAMAVMLRTVGIPARMATGFQSGVYNPISDLWLVRASDAHSWVEAWMPGHGWTTFDPTPPDPNPHGFALLAKAALYLDAAETFWEEWVVTYDITRQGTLAYRMELGAHSLGIRWFDAVLALRSGWNSYVAAPFQRFSGRIVAALAMAALIWLLGPTVLRLLHVRRRVERMRRGQASAADATLLYERMLHVLKRRGYQKPAWFTPAEFAASLPATQFGAAVAEFTTTYNALRFGGHREVAPRLSVLLDELEQAGRR